MTDREKLQAIIDATEERLRLAREDAEVWRDSSTPGSRDLYADARIRWKAIASLGDAILEITRR